MLEHDSVILNSVEVGSGDHVWKIDDDFLEDFVEQLVSDFLRLLVPLVLLVLLLHVNHCQQPLVARLAQDVRRTLQVGRDVVLLSGVLTSRIRIGRRDAHGVGVDLQAVGFGLR